MVLQEIQVFKALLVDQVHQVLKASKDHQDQLDLQAIREPVVHQDQKDQLVPQVHQGLLEHRDPKDLQVHLDHRVLPDQPEALEQLEMQAQMGYLEL